MAEKAQQQVNQSIENVRKGPRSPPKRRCPPARAIRIHHSAAPGSFFRAPAPPLLLKQAPGGYPSNYVDVRHGGGGGNAPPPNVSPDFPQAIAQQAQDPNHPANPKHSKHAEWAKSLAEKFGNAMVFGGGATLGSDVVNSAFNALKK
ncbi:hypothetical protein PG994_001122 [Apiospora phragmitis]|uniref:Uncharacterized protein n=1 Tax=Apiospora phragmitis TaxID=2905665 RepID=A0ABR1WSM8_9PEZI